MMMRGSAQTACLALSILSGAASAAPAWAQQTVFVVRHAEKVDASDDPVLSAAGLARAESLARHLKASGVTAILVNKLQRTQLTAAPLAAQLRLQPEVLDSAKPEDVVAALRQRHASGVVLVVGHSNTVPAILSLLGCSEKVTLADGDYDDLFVVVPAAQAPAWLLRLKY